MRSLFVKYWIPYLAGIAIIVIVDVAVLLQFFRFTNNHAQWFFNYIDNWAVISSAFTFVLNWAKFLSAAAVIPVLVVILIRFREIRRKRALSRVSNWARGAITLLTTPSNRKTVEGRLTDWKQRMMIIRVGNDTALADARAFGNSLEPKVEKAVENLLEFENCLNNHLETADIKALLITTVSAFKEIID